MARRPYTGRTTSAFGPRLAPIPGASTFHQGLDGVGGYNTAPEGGTIVGYSYAGGWGNRIVFQGDSDTVHYLAHNAPGGLLGRVGKWYPEGTNLGIKGMTGTATGVHVHWETRPDNGAPIDPETWLRSQGGASGGGSTPIETDEDMAHMELVQTPDGTVWFCYDRIFRYAIPNSRNLNTYTAHLTALGKSAKLIQKSAADITAYGSPVYADPLGRFAEPRDITAAQKAITDAIGKIPATGGGTAPANPDLAPALASLAASLKQLTDALG